MTKVGSITALKAHHCQLYKFGRRFGQQLFINSCAPRGLTSWTQGAFLHFKPRGPSHILASRKSWCYCTACCLVTDHAPSLSCPSSLFLIGLAPKVCHVFLHFCPCLVARMMMPRKVLINMMLMMVIRGKRIGRQPPAAPAAAASGLLTLPESRLK